MKYPALLLVLLLALPAAHARPPRHKAAPHKGAKAAPKNTKPSGKPGAVTPLVLADPQTLVSNGKMPAFFDPADLRKPPVISAPCAILVDADTGQVLWEKNADEAAYPASTTKIMTALLFIEHTKPDDIITCLDPKITQIEESSLHIRPWEKFPAEDLLRGFLLRSANDGAVVIAERVGGTVPKFADLMNARAQKIGATHTHFVTPNGLHDPDHFTTARDMALIACEALRNPRFAQAVGTPERRIKRSILTADSRIIAKAKKHFYDKFPGADGVKTGYTRQARHCFVGSATRGGRRLLTVIFGSYNSAISDTIPTLSWAFQRFPLVPLAVAGQPAPPVAVPGALGSVPTVAAANLHITTDALAPSPLPAASTDIQPAPGVVAPVAKGAVVGYLRAIIGGQVVAQTPLLAADAVPRSAIAAAVGGVAGNTDGPPWHLLLWGAGAGVVLLIAFWYVYTYAAPRRGGTYAPAKGTRRRRGRLAATRRGADRGG